MRRRIVLLMVLVALLAPVLVQGQDDRPMVLLNFKRQNDFTFATNLDTWYTFRKGRYSLDMRLTHTNIYNTTLTSDRFVQLYLRTSIWQHYKLHDKLDLASWLETDQYFSNRNEKINLYGGLRYKPYPFIQITPLVGYSWDIRTAFLGQSTPTARLDQGFTPAILFESDYSWPEQDLSVSSYAFARYKFIDPRRQRNVQLLHAWRKRFKEGVTLDIGARAASHELDDYQANSVKRIISDTILPHINLHYQFAPGLEWRSENTLLAQRRFFRFENQVAPEAEENDLTFDGLEISTRQRLNVVRKKWKASLTYHYLFSSRTYDLENDLGLNEQDFQVRLDREKQKDFVKGFHKVDLFYNRSLGKKQFLTLQMANQYLQFDTPSDNNFDDRDELSWVASTELVSRWRKNLFTGLGLSGNFRHYAFLLKEKSQDNYKQRSLRLDFRYGWDIGRQLRLEGDNAVYVTYNVKDFTDFNKTDRSTRNLETNFRAIYRPSKKLEAHAAFRRKETHQSYLNWAAFSETTLDTILILTAENRYRYWFDLKKARAKLFVEGGYKHFDQTKKFKASMVTLDNQITAIELHQINLQTGPLVSIGFRDRRQSTLDASIWMQVQVRKNRFQPLEDAGIFGAALFEEELRIVNTEFRPYMTLRFNYFFGARRSRGGPVPAG